MIKAIVFVIGQTLVDYKVPLNWSKLYIPAFKSVSDKCGYAFSNNHYQHAGHVLSKYNTRINLREYEVTSNQIFSEIIGGLDNEYALEDKDICLLDELLEMFD